jgi:hypothetical protein
MDFEKMVNRMQERKPFSDWRVKIYRRKDKIIINPVALQPYRALADRAAAAGQRS